MLNLRLKEKFEDRVEYYYQPEGKGAWGVVSMNLKTRNFAVVKACQFRGDYPLYRGTAFEALSKYVVNKNYPISDQKDWG